MTLDKELIVISDDQLYDFTPPYGEPIWSVRPMTLDITPHSSIAQHTIYGAANVQPHSSIAQHITLATSTAAERQCNDQQVPHLRKPTYLAQ